MTVPWKNQLQIPLQSLYMNKTLSQTLIKPQRSRTFPPPPSIHLFLNCLIICTGLQFSYRYTKLPLLNQALDFTILYLLVLAILPLHLEVALLQGCADACFTCTASFLVQNYEHTLDSRRTWGDCFCTDPLTIPFEKSKGGEKETVNPQGKIFPQMQLANSLNAES